MFAIAAISKNGVIGSGNSIPWRIKAELQWFRRQTLGRVVIMGRKTFESLPGPLEGRINVVLTRHPGRVLSCNDSIKTPPFADALIGSSAHAVRNLHQMRLPKVVRPEVRVVRSIDSLMRAKIARDAWLCGGAQVYAQFLDQCSELYLSVVDREVEGDAFFPPFEHLFQPPQVVAQYPEFKVLHYVRKTTFSMCGPTGTSGTPAGGDWSTPNDGSLG